MTREFYVYTLHGESSQMEHVAFIGVRIVKM
jgi:hypothetical protein